MTASPGRVSRGSFVKSSVPVASSLPGVGIDSMAAAKSSSVPATGLTTVSVVNMPPGLSGTLQFVLGIIKSLIDFANCFFEDLKVNGITMV